MKTYTANVKCSNCGECFEIEILVGYLIGPTLMERPCENCGCITLTKNDNPGRDLSYFDVVW
jgi:hypothetical protein